MSIIERLQNDINHFEYIRKKNTLKLFYFILFLMVTFFGLNAYYLSHYLIASLLLGVSLVSLVNLYFLFREKINHFIASNFLILPLALLMLYLVLTGGIHETGYLWIFLLPVVVFLLFDLKYALIISFAFIFMLLFVLFYPDFITQDYYSYSTEMKGRIFIIFLLESLLVFIYTYQHKKLFSKMKEYAKMFSEMSEEDQLTKLNNRRGIESRLEILYEQSRRNKRNFSVILSDIDLFKEINDRYGHQMGDHVLEAVSEVIKNTIRKSDMAARWGGEEFLIVLPDTDKRAAYRVAEKIRHNISMLAFYDHGREIKISISSGIAEIKEAGTIDNLIRQADEYMYQAKAKGRNITMPFMLNS